MHYIYIDTYYIYFWPFVSRQFTSDLWLTNTWTAPVLPSVAARWNLEMKQMTFNRVPQDVYMVPTGSSQGPPGSSQGPPRVLPGSSQGPHRMYTGFPQEIDYEIPWFSWYIIKFPDSFSVENIVKYKYSSPTCHDVAYGELLPSTHDEFMLNMSWQCGYSWHFVLLVIRIKLIDFSLIFSGIFKFPNFSQIF